MWTRDVTFGPNFASCWQKEGLWMLCKGAFVERMGLYVIFRQMCSRMSLYVKFRQMCSRMGLYVIFRHMCSSMLPTHKILKLFYFPL
jgi:hypothetical protein